MEGVHERVVGSTSQLVPTGLVMLPPSVGGMYRTGGQVNVAKLDLDWFSSATTFIHTCMGG